MSKMKLKDIKIRKIYDSRGEGTVSIEAEDSSGRFHRASVPSGKSRGIYEALVLPFEEAREVLEQRIKPAILKKKIDAIRETDAILFSIDGSEEKSKIGGNLALGVSIACARAIAFNRGEKLWKTLRGEFFQAPKGKITNKNNADKKTDKASKKEEKPRLFSNLINGGAHANNSLAIQEYMAIVKTGDSASSAVENLILVYRRLGEVIKEEKGIKEIPIGDEGGYSLDFKDNFAPIALLEKTIRGLGFEKEIEIGLDAAASGFYENGAYSFEGKWLSKNELAEIYKGYAERSELLSSIEDPCAQNDPGGFKIIKDALPEKLILGDDLTVTNAERIRNVFGSGAINGVIIKPNQVGTITESCEAMWVAGELGLKTVISHRSGETDDNFIIHLAKAGNAYGLKIGAPARERIFKFNEFTRIYDE